ncbi:hypothetical protein B0I00_0267 [Novosphingobium kunmingense]|uniref:Uncharacterized protein n=1 Tax=Novosphingobium kunmingense TaxID=1211806 RepID=A0A2N0I1P0_9SPHN|nr:hypothetical protein [Novosphingobium kunmingense]PKB25086.1 hypothetical protein B0I00_0267 [Novosphingobium kunmingense]
MKSFAYLATGALLAMGSTSVLAQNFTFESTANAPTTVGGPDMRGQPVLGASWTGTSAVTWADGRKASDKYTCVSTTQPSNAKIFDSHVICDGSNSEGTYSAVFGCQFTSKDLQSTGCVGGLTGRTGRYAGMGGTITFAGRSGNGSGTGTWAKAGN